MEQLIKSLPAVLRAAEDSDEVYTAACVAAWNYTAGESLRNNAVAVRFSDGKLTIAVGDPIWQKQLQPMVDQLIYRLNSILGRRSIGVIEFVVAPEIVAKAGERNQTNDQKRTLSEFPPEIISAAGNINDAKLRRAFLGAANSCLARKKRDAREG